MATADDLLRGGNGHGVQKLAGSAGVDGVAGSLGVVGFGGDPTTIGGLSGVPGFEIGTIGDDGTVPGGMYPVVGTPPPGPLTGTFPGIGLHPTGYPVPGKIPTGLYPGADMHPGISMTADTMNMPAQN